MPLMRGAAVHLNAETAKAIVEAAHAAWNERNLDGMLNHYVEDLIYWSNAGGPDNTPLTIFGKSGFRDLLGYVLEVSDSSTSIEAFTYEDGLARVQVSAYIKHRPTGLDLSGNFRQVLHFRDFRICKHEEFHDAAMLSTFWRLITHEISLRRHARES
jgi:ketosteroid isomerase-like protein